jgi:hypothetical protein
VLDKLSNKYKGELWRCIEDKTLSIIQLYADAFMMMEDKYPTFMRVYRLLRQEGVHFPARDPNDRYLIHYEGSESPAFELAEIEYQLKYPNQPLPEPPSRPGVRQTEKALCKEKSGNMLNPELTGKDYSTLANTLPLLDSIILGLNSIEDTHSESTQEALDTCQNLREKLILIVFHKAGNGASSPDTRQILKILDLVNAKLDKWDRALSILQNGGTNTEILETFQPAVSTIPTLSIPCNIDLLSL